MRSIIIFSLCGLFPLILSGCEIPAADGPRVKDASLEGLKLSDLKDPSAAADQTAVSMTFRVLTYEIGAEGIGQLQSIYSLLSEKDIRCLKPDAFKNNGFAVRSGQGPEGSEIAQKLALIGARRTAIGKMTLPADSTQILSAVPFQPGQEIFYSTAARTIRSIIPTMGLGGWTLKAAPDPRFRGMVQVSLVPAFWQRGFEDIRLRMGKEPLEYQYIEEGRFLARLEERGFLLLGPNRPIPVENTLDKVLFLIPGTKSKFRFFIIICDDTGD